MKKSVKMVLLIVTVATLIFPPTTEAACLSLGTDLFPDDSNQSVLFLQNYLVERGYLTATPNGHFGPATKAAVKAFQKTNGISQTGNVGPLTRNAISTNSCSSASAVNSVPSPSPTPTPTPMAPRNPITFPTTGDTLTTGKVYTITWNTPVPYVYDIVAEKSDGSSGGYIRHSASGGSSFSWRAGSVFSAATQSDITMATGTYRVRIVPASGLTTDNDPISGWFTLDAVPLSVSTVAPTAISADDFSSVVIVGSGFDRNTLVSIDSAYGQIMNTTYVAPDGKVLIFTVPTSVSRGSHSLYVSNRTPLATWQNAGTITVTK